VRQPTSLAPGARTREPWVSIEEVAAHLGVRKESVYRWIEGQGLPATKIGKLWKLRLSEVDTWLLARRGPARAPAAPSTARGRPSPPRAEERSSKGTVLVIDDDELVRDTLSDYLLDEDFHVLVAADGAAALDLLGSAAQAPCLIILDLKMPHLDGWEFLEVQAKNPRLAAIPVIVVTAVPEQAPTAAIVLPKPLRLKRLASALEAVLGATVETTTDGQSHHQASALT